MTSCSFEFFATLSIFHNVDLCGSSSMLNRECLEVHDESIECRFPALPASCACGLQALQLLGSAVHLRATTLPPTNLGAIGANLCDRPRFPQVPCQYKSQAAALELGSAGLCTWPLRRPDCTLSRLPRVRPASDPVDGDPRAVLCDPNLRSRS